MKKLILILTFLFSFQFALSEGADSSKKDDSRILAGVGILYPNAIENAKFKANFNVGLSFMSEKIGVMVRYSTFKFAVELDTKGVDELFNIKVDKEVEVNLNSFDINLTYGTYKNNFIPFAGVVFVTGQNEIASGLMPQLGLIAVLKKDYDSPLGINAMASLIIDNAKSSYLSLSLNFSLKLNFQQPIE